VILGGARDLGLLPTRPGGRQRMPDVLEGGERGAKESEDNGKDQHIGSKRLASRATPVYATAGKILGFESNGKDLAPVEMSEPDVFASAFAIVPHVA
jgi:hypothetical protein